MVNKLGLAYLIIANGLALIIGIYGVTKYKDEQRAEWLGVIYVLILGWGCAYLLTWKADLSIPLLVVFGILIPLIIRISSAIQRRKSGDK